MKVDRKILKKWKILVEGGEKTLIAKGAKLHKNTVSNAFKGYAAQETIDKINEYFKTRK
jgi:hypothetical protein